MNQAPVSVVIPTYNRREMVRDAIDSVLAQTLQPAQIVLVDDGSKEDYGPSLARYGKRITYHRQENGGLSAARNTGIRLAGEPYIAFIDDDDVWHPRKLELQMRAMQRDPEISLLGTDQFDWPAAQFPAIPESADARVARVTWEQLIVRTLIPISSVLVRRDLLDRVGLFDMTLRISQDRDLFLRVSEVAKVAMIQLPLLGYRDTPGSLCKLLDQRELEQRQILRQVDERGSFRGRWLLRCKAHSYMHHSCSVVHAWAGDHAGATARALKALLYYPLPYRRDEVNMPLARPKRLAVNLLRLARLKRPDAGPAAKPAPAADALQGVRRAVAERLAAPSLAVPSMSPVA